MLIAPLTAEEYYFYAFCFEFIIVLFYFASLYTFFLCDDLFDVTCSGCKYSYDAMLCDASVRQVVFEKFHSSESSSSIEIPVLQHISCSFIHVTYNWIFYVLNFSTLSSCRKKDIKFRILLNEFMKIVKMRISCSVEERRFHWQSLMFGSN